MKIYKRTLHANFMYSKKAAKSKVKKDGYVLKHRENFRSGCAAGSYNLLGLTLMELIEDSKYFRNDKIFLRVILDTPILREESDDIIKKLLDSKKLNRGHSEALP